MTEGVSKQETPSSEKESISHGEIQDLIVELGNNLNYFAEKEFRIDGYKLDVVWKRTVDAAPSEAFEVQKRGNLRQAIENLRHAWGKGISKLYLVVFTTKDKMKAERLVDVSLHDIKDHVYVRTIKEIMKWHNSTKTAAEDAIKIGGHKGLAQLRFRRNVSRLQRKKSPRKRKKKDATIDG